jgi:hypothetical protein
MLESEAKKFYEVGKKASEDYHNLFDAMWEENIPDYWPAQKAFDMGFNNINWEVEEYERLGTVPDGPSYNYMEQTPEKGVSVITEEWKKTIAGIFFLEKYGNREVTKFNGVFTGYFGGDGEPLVLPVE